MLNKLLVGTQTDTKKYSEFSDNELVVLQEYVQLTAPIVDGIDKLQGDKNTFYGDLLPTLFSIKSKLEKLSNLRKLGKLAQGLIGKLVDKRFKEEFKLEEGATMAICAAISHPSYKAQWGTELESEKALIIFKAEYHEMSQQIQQGAEEEEEDEMVSDGESFIQLRTAPLPSASTELSRFLLDQRKDLEMLNNYPTIRELFFKYNTQLPTSAIVERMFNFAGLLDTPTRNRILPSNFEANVLIKTNSVYARDHPMMTM